MKRVLSLKLTLTTALLALAMAATSGCFWQKKAEPERPSPAFTVRTPGNTNVVMTPAASVGRIASVNVSAKFAVINFPIGQVPPNETKLGVFRAGAKVGEIKVTGPAQENFTVGDITTGTAQEGDEVRAE